MKTLSIVTRDLESSKVAKFANLYTNKSSKHMGDCEELQMNVERLSGCVIEGRKISETKFIKSNIWDNSPNFTDTKIDS